MPICDPELSANRVSFVEILGHTVANITPSAMATVTLSLVVAEGGLLTWAVYLVVGFLMLLVAAQVATLAKEVPAAGSLFVSLSRALHPMVGILSGWCMTGGYLGALLAAPVIGGLFVAKAFPIVGMAVPWPFVAVVFSLTSWALTVRDVELATRYSLLIEAVSLVIIALIGVVTLAHVGVFDRVQWRAPFAASPFFHAITLSILAYGGFETAANFGREGRSPTRSVPAAILAAVVFSMGFYVFMAYAEMAGFANHPSFLAGTEAPLSALAVGEGLPVLAFLSDLAMAIAALSATIATLNSLSRLWYSMGRHRVLPAIFGGVGSRKTPSYALHILGALTTMFAVAAGVLRWSPLAIVNLFGVFTALGFIFIYLFAMVAVPVMRRRRGRPVSWIASLALLTVGPLLLYVFLQNFQGASGITLVAAYGFLAYLSVGICIYFVWRRGAPEGRDFAQSRDDD